MAVGGNEATGGGAVAAACLHALDDAVAARKSGSWAGDADVELALIAEDELDTILAVDVLRERIDYQDAEGWRALEKAAGLARDATDEAFWPRALAESVDAGARKCGLDPRWRGVLLELFRDEITKRAKAITGVLVRRPAPQRRVVHDPAAASPRRQDPDSVEERSETGEADDMQALLEKIKRGESLEPVGAAPHVDLGETLALLRTLAAGQWTAAQAADMQSVAARQAKSLDRGDPDGHYGRAVDRVGNAFSFIHEDAVMPDRGKAALLRLQLPYLRVALADARAFDEPTHPARRLLEGLASVTRASVGREAALDDVEGLVDAVLDSDSLDASRFEQWLAEWEPRAQRAQRAQELAESRSVAAQKASEVRESARRKVRDDVIACGGEGLAQAATTIRDAANEIGQAMFLSLLRTEGAADEDYAAWCEVLRHAGQGSLRNGADVKALEKAWASLGFSESEITNRMKALFSEDARLGPAILPSGESWLDAGTTSDTGGEERAAGEPGRMKEAERAAGVDGGTGTTTADADRARVTGAGTAAGGDREAAVRRPAAARVQGSIDALLSVPGGEAARPGEAGTAISGAGAAAGVPSDDAVRMDGLSGGQPAAGTVPAPAPEPVRVAWRVGMWVELRSRSVAIAAKLSWKSAFTGKWLLVSHHGLKVDTLTEDELVERIQAGRARVLPDEAQPRARLFA